KKYYKDAGITYLTGFRPSPTEVELEATGRQVPLLINNKITGETLAGATIEVSGTEAQTDQNGETTLVLPATQKSMEAIIKKTGYNDQKVRITVINPLIKDNTFGLTPVGKVYFL